MESTQEVKKLYFEILIFNYMKIYLDLLFTSKGSCLSKKSIFIPYGILLFASLYLIGFFTAGSVVFGLLLLLLSPLLIIWVNVKYYNVKNIYMKITNSSMLEKIKTVIGNDKFNNLEVKNVNLLSVLKVMNEKNVKNIPS